jgi:hypothetical protein
MCPKAPQDTSAEKRYTNQLQGRHNIKKTKKTKVCSAHDLAKFFFLFFQTNPQRKTTLDTSFCFQFLSAVQRLNVGGHTQQCA